MHWSAYTLTAASTYRSGGSPAAVLRAGGWAGGGNNHNVRHELHLRRHDGTGNWWPATRHLVISTCNIKGRKIGHYLIRPAKKQDGSSVNECVFVWLRWDVPFFHAHIFL